jgi:hypothetical protein
MSNLSDADALKIAQAIKSLEKKKEKKKPKKD